MKKCLSIITALLFAVVLNQQPVSAATPFTDLENVPWAEPKIEFLYEQGIVSGYGNGEFGPEDYITRAQVALMLTDALYMGESADSLPSFSDVLPGYFYAEAIALAEEKGLVNGYEDGTFRPSEPVTRAEVAVMVDRAYALDRDGAAESFGDISKLPWATEHILDLSSHNILNGYEDGTFKPANNIERAEFSVVLAKTINPALRAAGTLMASFIDVGQGDSILLETPTGKNILVDGGDRSAGDTVVNYLAEAGIDSLDLVVATHPDADHIGGLIDVLNQVEVKKVLDSGQPHTTETYEEYLGIIEQKNIPFETATEGETLDLASEVGIQVLNALEDTSDTNESSVVLEVTHGEIDFLLMGDASVDTEAEMIQQYDLDADILKVGHHGSETSTSAAFVTEVDPEVGILSYGENSYGHPDPDVTERLWSQGAALYTTCGQGTINVTSDGAGYVVHAEPFTGSNVCTAPADQDPAEDFPVNVNTADYETLQLIPQVGPAIAENIIAYRSEYGDFQSVEELENVSYIGSATLEEMKPYITL